MMDVFRAFEKSIREYSEDPGQKSIFWQQEFDRRKHLYEPEFLKNFRNNKLSETLDDQFSSIKQKEIFCDLLSEIGEEFVFSNLTKKNIGNSQQVFTIDDKFVDAGQCYHIKWFYELTNFVFSKMQVNYICEIGGGYGSLAQKIRSNRNCKYMLVDLPEANILTAYYLEKYFPTAKFLLADQVQNKCVERKQIDEHDFIIIPPWYDIQGVKFDLMINTRSMMEMNMETIQKYFDFIHGNIAENGYFFNINRYYKDVVGYPIKLSEYPYDEHWSVISSQPSWKQVPIHQLLTQRVSGRGNIYEELIAIEALYQENKKTGKDLKKITLPKKVLLILIVSIMKILKRILPPRVYKTVKKQIISQL
jgi:putative sugar O-methyltransferase